MSVSTFSASGSRESRSSNNNSNGYETGKSYKTVYLSPSSNERIEGVLGYLVRLFHLDVYSTNLLTRSVLFELKAISLALAIMFLFDLAAWTFFWNMVFYNGQLALGFKTPIAILFGFMFAMIIVIYERQWVVTDLSLLARDWKSRIKILGAFAIRLFIIVLAAYATAQPVEVLFFSGQIQKRIHEESVRNEVVAQFRDYQDKVNKTKGATAYTGTQTEKDAITAQERYNEAIKKKGELEGELNRAKQEVQAKTAALSRARNIRDPKTRAASVGRAQGRLNTAQEAQTNAQKAVDANASSFSVAETGVKLSSGEIKNLEKAAEDEKQRIVNWIKQLRRSNPGETIVEKTEVPQKFEFNDKDYDFFERMTIIDDLHEGRAPKWIGAEQAEVENLKKEFAFGDTSDEERRIIDAASFKRQWVGLLIITFIFPLSVIAMKFLMSADKSLMNYYSHAQQSENPDYAVHLGYSPPSNLKDEIREDDDDF